MLDDRIAGFADRLKLSFEDRFALLAREVVADLVNLPEMTDDIVKLGSNRVHRYVSVENPTLDGLMADLERSKSAISAQLSDGIVGMRRLDALEVPAGAMAGVWVKPIRGIVGWYIGDKFRDPAYIARFDFIGEPNV